MTKGQTGTSNGTRTELGRLTTAPSRTRRRSGGISTSAARIAAIPEPPAEAAAPTAASAETHPDGSPVAGSGDSRTTASVSEPPSGRVSRRACEGAGDKPSCPGAARCASTRTCASSERRETGVVIRGATADAFPDPWPWATSSSSTVIVGTTVLATGAGIVCSCCSVMAGLGADAGGPGGVQKALRSAATTVTKDPIAWPAPCCVVEQLTVRAAPPMPPVELDAA